MMVQIDIDYCKSGNKVFVDAKVIAAFLRAVAENPTKNVSGFLRSAADSLEQGVLATEEASKKGELKQ